MHIDPTQTLPLVYQLKDPLDTTVYYVRAVIRDSLTGATIGSKNLVSVGAGRYTSSISAPPDPSGLGRHIDITINVYTDSGYTTNSEVYERTIDKYLIKKSAQFFGGSGASSGVDINYDKIQRMIDAATAKVLARFEKITPTNLEPILSYLGELEALINGIEPVKVTTHTVNVSPIIEAVQALEKHVTNEVAAIEIPEPEEFDLKPVLAAIEKLQASVEENASMSESQKDEIKKAITQFSDTIGVQNKEKNDRIKKAMVDLIDAGDISAPVPPQKRVPSKYVDNFFGQKS